jgi:hypothetical protein
MNAPTNIMQAIGRRGDICHVPAHKICAIKRIFAYQITQKGFERI